MKSKTTFTIFSLVSLLILSDFSASEVWAGDQTVMTIGSVSTPGGDVPVAGSISDSGDSASFSGLFFIYYQATSGGKTEWTVNISNGNFDVNRSNPAKPVYLSRPPNSPLRATVDAKVFDQSGSVKTTYHYNSSSPGWLSVKYVLGDPSGFALITSGILQFNYHFNVTNIQHPSPLRPVPREGNPTRPRSPRPVQPTKPVQRPK